MILLSELLTKVNEKEIMEHYYQTNIIDKKAIYRNITRDDSTPTCYFNWYNGKYFLVDRSIGISGNFCPFKLVQTLYKCTFYQSLYHINKDMNLGLSSKQVYSIPGRKIINKETKSDNKRKTNYKIKSRKWNDNDIKYWETHHISLSTLTYFNVIPVKEYQDDCGISFKFNNRYKYNKDHSDPCYVYVFKGKKSIRVKLYRPFNTIINWNGNLSNKDIFGYNQLPEYSKTIYIASGLKDLMCLYEMGLSAIAPQSETSDIPDYLIEELRLRCRNLIILFDNDNAGINSSKKYSSKYQCRYISLPKDGKNKDIAEYVKEYGIEYTKQLILKSKLLI